MEILLTLSILVAFTLSYLAIPRIIRLAHANNWMDTPGGRKQHEAPTPSLGGIAIFAGFWVSTLSFLALEGKLIDVLPILIAGSVLFLIGLKDDLREVSALKKLFIQLSVATLLFEFDLCRLNSLYGLLQIHEIPPVIDFVLSVLTTTLIINAYNLIDGINGLSGSLTVLASTIFAVLFLANGQYIWAAIALNLVAATLGFLRYNFGKAVIFMGDNGSTFVGMIISILFYQLIHIDYPVGSMFATGLAIISIPVFDLIRVFIFRLSQKRGPFSPDRSHIHHILLNKLKDVNTVVYSILGLNVFALGMLWISSIIMPVCLLTACLGATIWFFPVVVKRLKLA